MSKRPSNKVKLDLTVDPENNEFLEKEHAATGLYKSQIVNGYITEKRKAKSRKKMHE